jgi:hypothetical protein
MGCPDMANHGTRLLIPLARKFCIFTERMKLDELVDRRRLAIGPPPTL